MEGTIEKAYIPMLEMVPHVEEEPSDAPRMDKIAPVASLLHKMGGWSSNSLSTKTMSKLFPNLK